MNIWPEGSPSIAQRRPLTQEEFERLQQYLACMRMICDTPAILDPECRVCPKLEELEGVLGELLEEPARKIVVFSEWVKMLEFVRGLAAEMGVDCAWHTGDVPQLKRRAEIARFREDPACQLFLSSDAGATGLNLQMANAVINLDLPWNPAKLEQRIARAWRKGQKSAVTVVNFVTENSIEHSILHLLSAKQTLADGVLDGAEDFSKIAMPSGRAAMIERMQAMLGGGEPIRIKTLPPEEALVEDMKARHGARLLHAELRAQRLLLVLDAELPLIAAERIASRLLDAGERNSRSRRVGDAAAARRGRAHRLYGNARAHPPPERGERGERRRRTRQGEVRSRRAGRLIARG